MPDTATARIVLDPHRRIAPVSPLLFGGFAEHLGRCIYGGLYDPDSPHADEQGFRKDVLAALRDWKLSILRWPGGNMVSNYTWRDGIGPKSQRPRRRELAWQSIEPNTFGTDEFLAYCRKLNCEPMMGLNFGTGSIRDAADYVEYCNAQVGTQLADLRAANGREQPWGVKYWCLGNEMDGSWQMGAMTAREYGTKAREAGKLMKWQDSSIRTILCGSSNPRLASFPEWDRVVLEEAWEQSDYLSLHNYGTNWEDDTPSFLAYAVELEHQVDVLSSVLRYVKALKRSKHDVYLCWDEWNVWYKDRTSQGGWTVAPHLCEEVYNLEDALVVAQWLNVLIRRCDVVRIACIAQVVNALSPMLTTRDALLKQTTYYPFLLFSQLARGEALEAQVEAPTYDTKRFGPAPLIDVSATWDHVKGQAATFIVNRSLSRTLSVDVQWPGGMDARVSRMQVLSGLDPKATNTFDAPERIVPEPADAPAARDGRVRLELKPLSFTVLEWEGVKTA